MPNDTHPVTLPTAAQQAAHEFGDGFEFSETNANSHAADHEVPLPLAAGNMADEATEHIPDDKFSFPSTASLDTQPLDNVLEQATSHLPQEISPQGLPSEAVEHISDTAETLLDDKFIFISTAESDTQPLEQVPEQAAAPEEIPLQGLPTEAFEHISDTPAWEPLTAHADWLVS